MYKHAKLTNLEFSGCSCTHSPPPIRANFDMLQHPMIYAYLKIAPLSEFNTAAVLGAASGINCIDYSEGWIENYVNLCKINTLTISNFKSYYFAQFKNSKYQLTQQDLTSQFKIPPTKHI